MPDGQLDPSLVTVREVYAIVDGIRREQEMAHQNLEAHVDNRLKEHLALHVAHEQMHVAAQRRFRWALGAMLTAGGLLGGFANHLIDLLAKH